MEWDPEPSFSCPLCSLLFFLPLLNLSNECVEPLVVVFSLLEAEALSSSDKSSGAFLGFPNDSYQSRSELSSFHIAECSFSGMARECPELPHFSSYHYHSHLTSAFYNLGEAEGFHAIPSASYYTPNVSCW